VVERESVQDSANAGVENAIANTTLAIETPITLPVLPVVAFGLASMDLCICTLLFVVGSAVVSVPMLRVGAPFVTYVDRQRSGRSSE